MVVHFMAGPPPTLFHQGLFHVDMVGSNAAWARFTCAVLQGLWEQDILALQRLSCVSVEVIRHTSPAHVGADWQAI
jgi:hypothetical protein